jgi:hypothetical protein
MVDPSDTVYGIVTDNYGIIVAAKYAWDPIKFSAGYEYIWQNNPKNPLGVGASDQGGYRMSGVEDNNLDHKKLVNIWWTGAKCTYRSKTDITFFPGINSGKTPSVSHRPAYPEISAPPARRSSTRERSRVQIS